MVSSTSDFPTCITWELQVGKLVLYLLYMRPQQKPETYVGKSKFLPYQGVSQRPLTLILLQTCRDTNGRHMVIQIGGVYTTFCQEEGIRLQKYRDRNGRGIAILFKIANRQRSAHAANSHKPFRSSTWKEYYTNERQSLDSNRGATNAGSVRTSFCVFEGDVTADKR